MRRQTPRRLHVSRRFIASGTILGLAFAFSTTAVGATEVVDNGVAVSGTITSAGPHLPMPGVCVYPLISGMIQGQDSLAGDYYDQQTLPGACTDAAGKYSVTVPQEAAAKLPAVSLLIVPSNGMTAAQVVPASGPLDVQLQAETGTASGMLYMSGNPVNAGLVEVLDSEQHVIGAAFTNKNGLWFAGIAGANTVRASARPLGPVGANLSADLVAAATQQAQAGNGIQAVFPDMNIPDTATVNGRVYVEGATPHPWQVIHADCVVGCTSGVVGITDDTGAFSVSVPTTATVILGYGGVLLKRSFELGTTNLPPVKTVPRGGRAITYSQAPQTWFAPTSRVTFSRSVTWSWTGASLESAPYEFNKDRALSTWHTSLSPYSDWVTDFDGTETVNLAPGQTRCERVRTVTALAGQAASVNGTPVIQCVTLPLDERALTASKAWRKSSQASSYNRTLTTAASIRATLSLTHVTGHQLMVVFMRTPKGGSFTISVNGKVVKALSTAGKATTKVLVAAPVKAMKNATVVIKTTNGKAVSIDGLAVLP